MLILGHWLWMLTAPQQKRGNYEGGVAPLYAFEMANASVLKNYWKAVSAKDDTIPNDAAGETLVSKVLASEGRGPLGRDQVVRMVFPGWS